MSIFKSTKKDQGYTLIEVLAVMVVLSIITAIAVPIYLNQRKTAYRFSVQSDLSNAIIYVTQDKQYGVYPTTLPTDIKVSKNVVLTIKTSNNGENTCIEGYHESIATEKYYITPETKKPILGSCP